MLQNLAPHNQENNYTTLFIEDGYHTRTAIDGRTAALLSTDGLDGRVLIYGRAGRLCALVKFKILCDRSLEVPSTMASAMVVGI